MSHRLPNIVDCWQEISQLSELSGVIPVKDCPNLSAACHAPEGTIEARLFFGRNDNNEPQIRGTIKASLTLLCQRCLEPMQFDIQHSFTVMPVLAAELENIPEDVEAVLLEDESTLSLVSLLEEECLLALPIVPKHPVDVCGVTLHPNIPEKKRNPFQVLAHLKKE